MVSELCIGCRISILLHPPRKDVLHVLNVSVRSPLFIGGAKLILPYSCALFVGNQPTKESARSGFRLGAGRPTTPRAQRGNRSLACAPQTRTGCYPLSHLSSYPVALSARISARPSAWRARAAAPWRWSAARRWTWLTEVLYRAVGTRGGGIPGAL